jgi:hypothetical protein
MNLHEEIAKVARELYEKSGRIEGRDRENWIDAERIVLSRHAGQDMEEPEGEEALIEEETIVEEVEGTELKQTSQENDRGATVMEEIEVKGPFTGGKKGPGTEGAPERVAKKVGSKKQSAPRRRETSKKKTRT